MTTYIIYGNIGDMKLITTSFTLPEEINEQLRKFAFVNRISKSLIVRNALLFYFKTPEQRHIEEEKCK